MNTEEIFYREFVADDSKQLSDILTKEYELQALKDFFCNHHMNEHSLNSGNDTFPLTISEVHKQFPIEVIRNNDYSVYKVVNGGYYYVFWIKPFDLELGQTAGQPVVYFTAYILSPMEESDFDSLEMGISTAEDVYLIDPSFELIFLASNGIYSYSYLNEGTMMEIEYTTKGDMKYKCDLIVKCKTVVERESALSKYKSILSKDLP